VRRFHDRGLRDLINVIGRVRQTERRFNRQPFSLIFTQAVEETAAVRAHRNHVDRRALIFFGIGNCFLPSKLAVSRKLLAPSIDRPGSRRLAVRSAPATPAVARRTSSWVARSGARASGARSGSELRVGGAGRPGEIRQRPPTSEGWQSSVPPLDV
jgi:hypothetical protein